LNRIGITARCKSCGEVGEGRLESVVVKDSSSVEGRYLIEGTLVFRCGRCGSESADPGSVTPDPDSVPLGECDN